MCECVRKAPRVPHRTQIQHASKSLLAPTTFLYTSNGESTAHGTLLQCTSRTSQGTERAGFREGAGTLSLPAHPTHSADIARPSLLNTVPLPHNVYDNLLKPWWSTTREATSLTTASSASSSDSAAVHTRIDMAQHPVVRCGVSVVVVSHARKRPAVGTMAAAAVVGAACARVLPRHSRHDYTSRGYGSSCLCLRPPAGASDGLL